MTPNFEAPGSLTEWIKRREEVRAKLWELLGDLPPRPKKPKVRFTREERDSYVLERFEFDSITGYLLLPQGQKGRRVPAILYNHWHGGDYHVGKEELFRSDHLPVAPGPALVKLGFAVMCIDAPCFGSRNIYGSERGQAVEWALAKLNLWEGRTLWGMILRDDLCALDYLASRPEIDPERIGAMGISMGATRTWWLMALDERIRCGAAIACLTRYQELIAAHALNAHGIYYYVPRMLKHFDTEAVLSLIAPRPILFLNGDRDAGSPLEGIRTLERLAAPFWVLYGQSRNFRSLVEPNVGHECTETMWTEAVAWLARGLENS